MLAALFYELLWLAAWVGIISCIGGLILWIIFAPFNAWLEWRENRLNPPDTFMTRPITLARLRRWLHRPS